MVNWKKFKNSIPHFVQVSKKGIYEVLYTDDFLDGNTLGETRFNPKQIILKNGMSPKDTVTTFIHEIIHSFSNEYEANITESQVRALEKGSYYLLKFNNIFKSETKNVRKRRKTKRRKIRQSKITRKSHTK